MIYLFLFILLLILSFRYDFNGKTKYCGFWYRVVLLIFVLVAGLRWRLGTDTPSYIYHFYHDIPLLEKLTEDELGFGAKPLWNLLNSLVKTMGGRFYIVQFVESTFVNVLIFVYIKKHSRYIFCCLFFYYLTMYFSLNMEVMKAAMSIVICLFANDYVLEKKWLKAYLLYIFAVLFHPQAIVVMLMPLFLLIRLNWFGVMGLIALYFVGIIINATFGDYLLMFELDESIGDKAEYLASSEKYLGQEHSHIYMLKTVYIYIIYAVISLWYLKRNTISILLKFEPYLMFYIGFHIITINVFVAYRFSMYYTIYLVLFVSEVFVDTYNKRFMISKGLSFAKSLIIVMPFIFLVGQQLVSKSFRYYPYSSVITRKVDQYREQRGIVARPNWRMPNKNEY